MRKINYIKSKRAKCDYCNICGRKCDLSWDHVPPQGVTNGEAVIINTVFEGIPQANAYMKKYQNGIKFRTICSTCNNVVLGQNDELYKTFINDVESSLRACGGRGCITVDVKVNRLCRALIGHVLAAKDKYDPQNLADQKMRQYVLNPQMKLSDIKVKIWIYPYETIVIARDFAVRSVLDYTHPDGMVFGIVLSYPLAYMVYDGSFDCRTVDLGAYTSADIDEEITIEISTDTMYVKGSGILKDFDWPINVGNNINTDALMVLGDHTLQEDSRIGLRR